MRQLHSQSRLPQSPRQGGRHDIPQQQGKNLKPRRSPPSALPIDRPRAPALRSRSRDEDPGPSTPLSKEPSSGSEVAEPPSGHEERLSYGNAQGAVNRLDGVRFPGRSAAIAEVAEVIAARVVEMLEQGDRRPARGLVTAAYVAERLGVCKSWVYANKTRLGAVKLGSGSRARLRFDLDRVVQELGSPITSERHIPRGSRRARSRKMALPPGVELLTGRSSR